MEVEVEAEAAVEELVGRFYAAMERLPEARRIRAMHPASLDESRDKLATFLVGWMGGPRRYRERFERAAYLRGDYPETIRQRVASIREEVGIETNAPRAVPDLWPVKDQLRLWEM